MEIRTAHTSDLDRPALRAVRALLDDVFADDMTEHDWEHALGGVHALAAIDGELVGHASVVMRRLLHGGRALRTGYVEAVAVRADARRRGVGEALMRPLHGVIRGAYELGALGSSEMALPFYRALGWQAWEGTTWALTPDGIVRTADEDDGILVLPAGAELDLRGELVCDWRDGDCW